MVKYFSAILICITALSCRSQGSKNLIDNWKNYPVPTNPDTLRKYNYSNTDWAVTLKNGSVFVSNYNERTQEDLSKLPIKVNPTENEKKDIRGKVSFLKVNDGYLVGFYAGEWGGSLFWFSTDGKKHYKVSDDEIVQFITRSGKNYAIQGLAHLSMSEGSIIVIEKVKEK